MTVSLDTLSSPTLHDPASLLDYFTELADPRREQGRFHRLDEIIFISICAVTCGADSWEEIASYAHSKIDWLQTVLTLPGGVPSHDTFRRVFCLLDPLAFQECFYAWMTAVMNRRGLPPSPSIRRNSSRWPSTASASAVRRGTVGQSALHVVSAWSVENHLTLGQVATDAKSNEITAIPELLELLGPGRGRGDHRCHGLSERHRRQDRRRGWPVRAGRQGEPAASLRGHRAGVRRGSGSGRAGGRLHRVPDRRAPEGSPGDAQLLCDHQPEGDTGTRACGRG